LHKVQEVILSNHIPNVFAVSAFCVSYIAQISSK